MNFVITKAVNAAAVLEKELMSYFETELRINEIFLNYPHVRVSRTHPFAYLIDKEVNNVQVPTDLFPSVTVIDETDSQAVMAFNTLRDAQIGPNELADIAANPDNYIVSADTITAIETLLETKPSLYSVGADSLRGYQFSIEIWADNIDIKDWIYLLIESFFTSKKRFDLNSTYGVTFRIETMNGQKSGQYNFDFGKMMYGATIKIEGDASIEQYFIDSDEVEITEIIHTYKEIHDVNA